MRTPFKTSHKNSYLKILHAAQLRQPCFAILIDPEEVSLRHLNQQLQELPRDTTHLFVGGSTATARQTQMVVRELKKQTSLPVILFPGDYSHITNEADGMLFLSLISGENAEYLIGQQIKSVEKLKNSDLEIIPTGYMLIDGGIETAVQRVSKTKPLSQENSALIVNTALAGEYLGKKLIYLEAGSGALQPVATGIIQAVREAISVPLIVGGGIKTRAQRDAAYQAGADLVVVGTAFEHGNFRS